MNAWALTIVFAASALAILLLYSASPHQRGLRRPLAAFPARASASLAAIVALRGWIEALGLMAGMLAWLASISLVAGIGYWMVARADVAARRRISGFHSWNAR